MEEVLRQLVAEFVVIKWLLFLAVALLLVVSAFFIVTMGAMRKATKNSDARAASSLFQDEADSLSKKGAFDELKNKAQSQVAEFPGDPWAHYYLAEACYRLGQYVEAKKHFIVVGELSPVFKSVADQSLLEIEAILGSSKPKAV